MCLASAGANRTEDQRRYGLNVDYHASFLMEEEIQVLSNPPALARHMPVVIQELLGYDCQAGAMGYFGVRQQKLPFALLRGDACWWRSQDFQHPIESFAFDSKPVNWAASLPKL